MKKIKILVTVICIISILIILTLCIVKQNDSDNDTISKYCIMVENDTVIEGKEQFQSFFDAYINGEDCTLDIFDVDSFSDGVYTGVSRVFEIKSGNCNYYEIGSEHGKYKAYKNAEFSKSHTFFTKDKPAKSSMPFIALMDGTDYICFSSHDVIYKADFNMDFIENSYENSDKLYDITKADTLIIENGEIKNDENILYDFLKVYFDNRFGFLHISGDNDMVIGKYDYHDTLSIINGEPSTKLDLIISPVWSEQTVTIGLWNGYDGGRIDYNLLKTNYEKAYEKGLFFYGVSTVQTDGTHSQCEKLALLLQKEINANALTDDAHKDESPIFAYVSGNETFVYFYKNPDGTVSDVVKIFFPESYKIETRTTHPFKVSKAVTDAVNDIIKTDTSV